MTVDMRRNNLDRSSSPYLRQHRDNPVWWQEWSAESLAAAREEKRPLFVSVGYSTCHWCHVMAAEAFSDGDTADYMNRHFICVKVDRETRPDIDQFLMEFMQSQSGSGGWPLNVFLTPDLRPIYALTYAPARASRGMLPLRVIAEKVLEYSNAQVHAIEPFELSRRQPQPAPEDGLASTLLAGLDPLHGGFGPGPKFPPHSTLLYMLYRQSVEKHPGLEEACRLTLNAMRRGGLHDHLQGGIFRYCVDREWAIPHFEKMLYDQAMALWCFALAYRVLADEACKTMAAGILRCLEETFAMDGLFATAFDADTGHHEGTTYTWHYDELKSALNADEFARLSASYRLPPQGNFEGLIHLTRSDDRPLPDIEEKLLALRKQKPQPDRDEKVLCGVNALVACAHLQASRALDQPELEEKAARMVHQLLEVFWDGAILAHSLSSGAVQRQGFLSDAGALLLAVTMLRERDDGWQDSMNALAKYTASFRRDGRWIESSHADFQDVPASWFDHPVPSSIALASLGLARAEVLNGSQPPPLDYLQPHQSDFFNVAAMFSQGLFHQLHSGNTLPWGRLPVNSIQLRGEPEADCYKGKCRPLEI